MAGFSRLGRVLAAVEDALVAVSCLAMTAIMLVVVVDVVMRYVFAKPLLWSYDLISLYLMVALFFFALPYTLERYGHVSIDVFVPLLPRRLRHLLEAIGCGAIAAIFAAIAWLSAGRLGESYVNGELMASAVSWPTWVAQVPVVLGAGVLTLRCLYRAVGHGASVLAAVPLISFAPAHESEGGGE